MKILDQALQAHLASGATTLCHCWLLVRRDGVVMGFTDHDQNLTFKDKLFLAHAGLDAAQAETQLGFAVSGSEVSGALLSDVLTEEELSAGVYDGASLETWLVNWASTDQCVLLDVAMIGQVRCVDSAFTAELRSMAASLNEDVGRLYQTRCSADLGDHRCKVDLSLPGFTISTVVVSTDGRMTFVTPEQSMASGWFTAGQALFKTGANAKARVTIKDHQVDSKGSHITLWTPLPALIASGDQIELQAGCCKSLSMCRDKFGNLANFRGFSLMPGNDVVTAYANSQVVMDGGSLFQ